MNKSYEHKFRTEVVNELPKQELCTRVLNKSCGQKLWAKLWTKVVNKSLKQAELGVPHSEIQVELE